MMYGGMMKQAVYALNDGMKQLGREIDIDEIAGIVQSHAVATSLSAAASGFIPGAGGVVAMGIACTSTITMYGRLAHAMGVRLNNGLIRAIASAVVADLAAALSRLFEKSHSRRARPSPLFRAWATWPPLRLSPRRTMASCIWRA